MQMTTLSTSIPDELHRMVKAACATDGLLMKRLFTVLLHHWATGEVKLSIDCSAEQAEEEFLALISKGLRKKKKK